MNWKSSPPLIEIAARLIAAACLGGAVGFAVVQTAPLVAACSVALLAALGGWILIGQVDRRPEPQKINPATLAAGMTDDDVLLLDDPLPVSNDPRVVRLFAALPANTEAVPALIGPSEMIARIEGFLGQSAEIASDKPARDQRRTIADDANTALHVALADIRRSLRQA